MIENHAALAAVEQLVEAARTLSHFLEHEKETREPPKELLDLGYAALETFSDYEAEEKHSDALLAALARFEGDSQQGTAA